MSPRFVYCTLVDRCLSISLHHSTTPSTHTLPLVNQYPAQHNRLKKIANQYWMTWRLYRSYVLNVSIYVPCTASVHYTTMPYVGMMLILWLNSANKKQSERLPAG